MGWFKSITKLIFKPPPEPIPKVITKPKPNRRKRRTSKKNQEPAENLISKNDLVKIFDTGAFLGTITEQYKKISENMERLLSTVALENTLEEIQKNVAMEKTLKDLHKVVAKQETLNRIDKQFFTIVDKIIFGKLKSEFKTGKSIQEIKLNTENFMNEISEHTNKQLLKTKGKVEVKLFERSKKLILDALRHSGGLPFGDDGRNYGLTEQTHLSRSWLYKACYLGWNSKGTVSKPEKNTLLAQGKIEIDRSSNRFIVALNKGTI